MDLMIMFAALCASILILLYLYRRRDRRSLRDIPGPQPTSFLLGNLRELYQCQVGETEFKWQSMYGSVVHIKGALGQDQLLVSDPKALQYIFHTSGYNFPKLSDRRVLTRAMIGNGILYAEGHDHKRHRRLMLPGFGGPEAKAYLSVFKGCAEQLSARWSEILENAQDRSAVLNIPSWLSRATLDAIGEAAFDFKFNSITEDDNPVAKAYMNYATDLFGLPSASLLFTQSISEHIPRRILQYLWDHGSSPRLDRMRKTNNLLTDVARDLVKDKAEMLSTGKGHNDIFSLLVKANTGESSRANLTETELYAQMRTILFAGHETTANTVSWGLLELARHPEMQRKLRAEIHATEANVHARGDFEMTIADLDAMQYTTAFMKEVLRYHPIAYHSHRCAAKDDVLPLMYPITTVSGQVIHEIPISKGTHIIGAIAGYNRNKDVWGEDAHVFNPERWLKESRDTNVPSLGVYGNLMTFLGGIRSCIGWRFAVVEIQAFLIEIVGKFEFNLTDASHRIRREPCQVMVPTLEGEERDGGVQMPLRMSLASREE